MDPLDIVHAHYAPEAKLTRMLIRHSEQVRDKALSIAARVPHLNPDVAFIGQAAMLHDIGIFQTRSAKIGCTGPHPYIRHGVIGREILESHGLPKHALVCERHVGVGLTEADILSQGLPLPIRDMVPQSTEETIICYADEFFSKTTSEEHSLERVVAAIGRYGEAQIERFMTWHAIFSS